MLQVNHRSGFGAGRRNLEIITDGLQLHLDAGAILSVPNVAGYQVWLDLSGNNFHFVRGTGTTAEANDPTFNGTPGGMSANEYWLFDGNDFFDAQAAFSGSILRTMGRRDQPFTIENYWWFADPTTDVQLIGTGNATSNPNQNGLYWEWAGVATSRVGFRVTSGGTSLTGSATNGAATGTWYQTAITGQMNGSTGYFVQNGVQNGTFSANTGWTSGDSSVACSIGRRRLDAAFRPPNGTRVAIIRVYNRALTVDELARNFQVTRARFGI